MSEDGSGPNREAPKKRFSQPKFEAEGLAKAAHKLQTRRKYDEGYSGPYFDNWAAAFTIDRKDQKTRELFLDLDLDERNPYHWRALLEAFVQEYAVYRGRPKKKTLDHLFRVALDAIEVARGQELDRNNASALAEALVRTYRDKYESANFDDLRKDVARVVDLVGSLDEGALAGS